MTSLANAASAFNCLPSHERGILTVGKYRPLSLFGADASVEIHGYSAKVSIKWEYINETNHDVKAIAAFPLPLGWRLRSSTVEYEDEVVRSVMHKSGVCISCESASALSQTGMVEDRVPWSVASQEVPWTIFVGTVVMMTAVYEVPINHSARNGRFVFSLPSELFPEVQRPAESSLQYNMLFRLKNPKRLRSGLTIRYHTRLYVPMRGKVTLTRGEVSLGDVAEELPTKVDYHGDSAFTLEFTESLHAQRRAEPLVLACAVMETEEPLRLFLETDPREVVPSSSRHAAAVCLTPKLRSCEPNTELIFLVDSHSLASSQAVGAAIATALYGLPDSVYINVVISKNDDGKHLCVYNDGSKLVGQVPVDQVSSLVAEVSAQIPSTGASALAHLLHSIISQTGECGCGPIPKGYVRHVVLITDEGSPSQAESMIVEASQNISTCCVNTVGLSYSLNTDQAMLQLLARESGGYFEEAPTLQEVTAAVVQTLCRCVVPALANVEVGFVEPEVRSSVKSTQFPVVQQGTQRFFYALIPEGVTTLTVTATGRVGSTVVDYIGRVEVATHSSEVGTADDTGLVHIAAASGRIQHLVEDSVSARAEAVAEMSELSATFLLACPYTSLIQRRQNTKGEVLSHPLDMPKPIASKYTRRVMTYMIELLWMRTRIIANCATRTMNIKRATELPPISRLPKPEAPTAEYLRNILTNVVEETMAGPNVERLAPLQGSTGAFSLNPRLGTCVGISCVDMANHLPSGCPSHDAWATVLAVAAIDRSASRAAALVKRKAVSYLDRTYADGSWKHWEADATAMLDQRA